MAGVQTRSPRRFAHDHPRRRTGATHPSDRPRPGTVTASSPPPRTTGPLLGAPVPQSLGDHARAQPAHRQRAARCAGPTNPRDASASRPAEHRTWERRLKALPDALPTRIGLLGRHLVALIRPWAGCGRAVALDSTVLR